MEKISLQIQDLKKKVNSVSNLWETCEINNTIEDLENSINSNLKDTNTSKTKNVYRNNLPNIGYIIPLLISLTIIFYS
jgi:hypothetical protein